MRRGGVTIETYAVSKTVKSVGAALQRVALVVGAALVAVAFFSSLQSSLAIGW